MPINVTSGMQLQFWYTLSKTTGLTYYEVSDAKNSLKHRLIGEIQGYFTIVRYVVEPNSGTPFLSIEIYHEQVFDVEAVGTRIQEDTNVVRIFGRQRKRIEVFPTMTSTKIPYKYKKKAAERVADNVFTLVQTISRHVNPVKQHLCQYQLCKCCGDLPTFLVFLEHNPIFLCNEAIDRIDIEYGKMKTEHDDSSLEIEKGLPIGILVALGGGFVIAVGVILLGRATAVLSAGIFMGILKLMERAGSKQSLQLVATAGLLTVCSAFIGSYVVALWVLYSDGVTVDSNLFFRAYEIISSIPEYMFAILFFTFLALIIYSLLYWSSYRGAYRRTFKPKIEIIEDYAKVK